MSTFSFNLQQAPLETLQIIQKEIEQEIAYRRRMEVNTLIKNFEAAFKALQDAGVDVHVSDCDDEIDFRIHSWDDFYFN